MCPAGDCVAMVPRNGSTELVPDMSLCGPMTTCAVGHVFCATEGHCRPEGKCVPATNAAGKPTFACPTGYIQCPDRTCEPMATERKHGDSDGWPMFVRI